jgi:hypothetical protein
MASAIVTEAWHIVKVMAASLSELRDTFAYKKLEQLINQVFGE